MDKGLFETYKSQIIILILLFVAILYIHDITSEPLYTIQDVYVYCWKNPEVLITQRGDDCNLTMNEMYNENENFTRWRIDE